MNYVEVYELLSKPFITIDEIASILGCSRNSVTAIVKQVEKEIKQDGLLLPPSRKKLLPTEKVTKVIGIDYETVYQRASKTLK